MQATARSLGALILGAALLLPMAATAQTPAPPTTAPVSGTKVDEGKPQVSPPTVASPPTPSQGSTAVPGWNNPPKSWEAASEKPQYASIPGRETNVLIQADGRKWRVFHNGPLVTYGGWLVVVVFALLILVYLVMGKIRLAEPPTGRLIERFNAVERTSHWTMATCFVFLALTGAFMLWGKYLVLPWLGYKGFAWTTIAFKTVHNFVGPLFIFSLAVSFLIFVKDNLWRARDTQWMLHVGAMFKHKEVPSGRFNGGEKLWFWGGLVFLGLFVSVTGLILDFPNWNQGREAMQYANEIHAIAAVCFIAGAFIHIYIGTIGMEGAYQGMRRGYVDEEWAREHHLLWYEDVKAGRRPERIAPAGAQPATGD
ncbi:MAG TPA: formate dehydrogenase subunit gamma [Usitatibacter sp.]|jgi:formate dehydrogenase subunit gamma|nr:formate dehydrogenase subunit gamma [Usitatibacter sp.]